MTFFFTRSVLALYGRPSMIFCEYAAPMPGRASSWSLVAELISTRSAELAAVVDVDVELLLPLLACAAPWLTHMPMISARANSTSRTREMGFLLMVPP